MDDKSVIAQRNERLHSHSKSLSPGGQEATARVGTTMAIPLVLRRLRVDPSEVLVDVGLNPGLFDDPDNPVSYAARSRLLNRCVERTGCSHFGLLVGQAEGLHSLGADGYMAQSCDDVGSALRSICQLMHVQAQGTKVNLELDGPWAIFQCEIYEPASVASDQTYDGAVAIMFNIMRSLYGEDWRLARVLFAHRKPKEVAPYRKFFRAPLHFDAVHNGLVFPVGWLDRKLPRFDPVLYRMMQKQIDASKAECGDEFESQVMRLLRTAVLTGECSADRVADAFAMDARTLRRRLSETGTSFRILQQQCRLEIARQFLETSDMDVATIAEALHYANSSAFARAFRSWSGMAPRSAPASRRHAEVR